MAVDDTWYLRKKDPDGNQVPSKRHGRGLRYRVRWKGTPTRSFRTLKEAERHWLKVRTEQPEPEVSEATIAELVDRWLKTKAGLSKKGYQSCRQAAAHVLEEWRDRGAWTLTREEIQGWIAALTVTVRRKGTDGSTLSVIRPAGASLRHKVMQCLAGSIALAKLPEDPTVGVKAGKETRRPARYLTMAELNQLALAAGEWSSMVLFLGLTGVRVSEAAALNVGQVIVPRGRAHVLQSKNGEDREVPVARSVLDRLNLDRPAQAPLFLSPLGFRVNVRNWRRRVFYPAVRASGLGKVNIHDLRHTAASLAIANGADLKAVQKMLGHKSGKMTYDLYGHLYDEALDKVADRLDEAFRALDGYTSGTPRKSRRRRSERES